MQMFPCCSYITLINFVREQCLTVKTIVNDRNIVGKSKSIVRGNVLETFIDSPEPVIKSFQELGSNNEHPSTAVT